MTYIKKMNNKGQSLVETALVLPLIVLILTAIIDFGLLFNNYLIISNASREAARLAAVGKTDIQIITQVMNMTEMLNQASLSTIITPGPSSRIKGNEVTVTIKYNNSLITPLISAILPNPVVLQTKTVMRIE